MFDGPMIPECSLKRLFPPRGFFVPTPINSNSTNSNSNNKKSKSKNKNTNNETPLQDS